MPGPNDSLLPRPGHLYFVASPIGNLADVTERARAILASVDLIACEDTRVGGSLLRKLELPKKPLLPYHDANETASAEGIAKQLESGKSVALLADAGTPGISDPGFRLARLCRKRGLPVVSVPGPCAFVALLAVSGLPTDAFFFRGFLPPKAAARKRFLAEHRAFPHTIALYESCHRIGKLLAEIEQTLGSERAVCVGRELTKRFETIRSGPAGEVAKAVASDSQKGEFAVLIAPDGYQI